MSDEKPQLEDQICAECGESVAFGSGRFVNRIPILDSYDVRVEEGRPHPAGAWICAECDADDDENVDTIECPECGNKEDFYRTFIAYEKIWPDGKGGYGFKDEETIETTQIQCRVCNCKGRPEEFKY